LSREKKTDIFSTGKITLQPVLFCQQVFSAAVIARMELTNISDQKRNQLIPIPHPEVKEDWPAALSLSIENLFFFKYFYYSAKAILLSPGASKRARELDKLL